MPSINKVFLAGYCDGDPRAMGEGGNIVSFRLRMHEQVRKRGGESFVKTEYVTVKAFGEAADYIGMNVTDGTGVLVEGKIRTERWGGPEARKKETLVVADRIQGTGASEREELMEMGVTSEEGAGESQQGGESRGRSDSEHSGEGAQGQEQTDGHQPAASVQQPQETARDGQASGGEEQKGGGVAVPEPGTPEFERLKGIQRVPW